MTKKEIVAEYKGKLASNRKWAERAIVVLYNLQTSQKEMYVSRRRIEMTIVMTQKTFVIELSDILFDLEQVIYKIEDDLPVNEKEEWSERIDKALMNIKIGHARLKSVRSIISIADKDTMYQGYPTSSS